MSELKSGVIINYVSIFIRLATQFFITPFVIASLGVEEYGLYMLSSTVIVWLSLTDLGLAVTAKKYVTAYRERGEDDKQAHFMGQSVMLFSVLGAVALSAGIVCYFFLPDFFPKLTEAQLGTLDILYLLTLANLILSFPLRPLACVPGAYLKFVVPGLMSLGASLINAGLTVLLLVCGYKSIGLTVMNVGLGGILLLVNLFYAVHFLGVRFKFSRPDWLLYRELLMFSIWILLAQLLDLFYWKAGAPIVARLVGSEAVSLFTLSTSFACYFTTAATAISGVLAPKLMRMVAGGSSDEELTTAMIRIGRMQLALLSAMTLGFAVLGQDFLRLWVGDSIGEGVWTVWVGALVIQIPLLVPLTQNVGFSILQAKSIHRGNTINMFYTSVLCVVSGYLLTVHCGVLGMLIGTGAAFFLGQGVLLNLYYHRRAGLNIPRFFRETYRPAILPAVFLLLAGWGWTQIWSVKNWMDFFVAAGGYGALCAVVLFVCYLNKEEKTMFLDPLKRLCTVSFKNVR